MYYIQPKTNEDLVQWANSLAEIMNQRNRGDIAEGIARCVEQFQQDSFTIAVIGKAKRGKSTLINALMGRHDDTLAPIDKLPASSAITRFRYSDTAKACVFFQDGHSQNIAWNDIRSYVTEESNPKNIRRVATVVVEGPIEGLRQHVELVDTPGAGSIHEHHDELLHAFIPQADAVIFIVTARMPFDQDELNLLTEVKKADVAKVFFVINRVDEIDDEEDLRNAIQHNQALLVQTGVRCDHFYQISAKNAFLGRPGHGVDVLSRAIEDFLAKDRIACQRRRFISRVCMLVEPELQTLSVTLANLVKSGEEIEQEIQSLQNEYRKIENKKESLECQFRIDWGSAVNTLQQHLTPAKHHVYDTMQQKMNSYTSAVTLSQKIPTELVQTIESEIQPISSQFEMTAQQLCENLRVAYPMIDMDSQSRLMIHSNGMRAEVFTTIGTGLLITGNAAKILSSLGGLMTTFAGVEVGVDAMIVTAGSSAATKTSAPLLATLAGPVGWAIAGIGLAAISLAWTIRNSSQKNQIRLQVEKRIGEVFCALKTERVSALRQMGDDILNSFSSNLIGKKQNVLETLENLKQNKPNEIEIRQMTAQYEVLNRLMNAVAEG